MNLAKRCGSRLCLRETAWVVSRSDLVGCEFVVLGGRTVSVSSTERGSDVEGIAYAPMIRVSVVEKGAEHVLGELL